MRLKLDFPSRLDFLQQTREMFLWNFSHLSSLKNYDEKSLYINQSPQVINSERKSFLSLKRELQLEHQTLSFLAALRVCLTFLFELRTKDFPWKFLLAKEKCFHQRGNEWCSRFSESPDGSHEPFIDFNCSYWFLKHLIIYGSPSISKISFEIVESSLRSKSNHSEKIPIELDVFYRRCSNL